MAFSVNTPVGDGSTKQFAVNFVNGLFSRDSITVEVAGEVDGLGAQIPRSVIWINDGLIELIGDAPASGASIEIRRIMDKDQPAVDFEDGEILVESTIDRGLDHLLNSIHELLDGYGFESIQTNIGMNGNLLRGLGAPILPDDAARLADLGPTTEGGLRLELSSAAIGEGSDLVAHAGTANTVTQTLDQNVADITKNTSDIHQRTIYVGSVAELEALDPPVGTLVETKGYNSPGDFGANTYEIVAAGTGTADGGTFIDLPSARQARGLFKNNIAIPQQFGAVGDAVADDYDEVVNALSSGYFVFLPSLYGTSKEISIPDRARLGGLGDNTGFKWVGAAPASVPDKTGGTAVLRFATATPATSALSNVFATSFKVDCAFTENLIGTVWIYASVQTRGEFIAVRDVGVNGIGHYFSKEWYASFDSLSVRGGSAGSIGYMFSANHNQINAVPFRNIQAGNDIETGIVIDTSDTYHYKLDISGTIESGVTGLRHIGGLGVRQGTMSIYFEGFTGDTIDWTTPVSPPDRTGQILWQGCQFFTGAVVNLAEGNHKFEGSGTIGTLNASGNASVMLDGNAGAVINITDSAEVRRNPTVSRRTNGAEYASQNTDPMVGKTQIAAYPSGAASQVFSIPDTLLGVLPSSGAVLKVSITGRRTYAGVERFWEGWLTFTSGSSWVLTPFSFSSPNDSVWEVSVDGGTGDITVRYNASDGKAITVTHMPA